MTCPPITTKSTSTPRNGSATSSRKTSSRPETLTSEASLTCARPTLPDTTSAISSPGSADGQLPSDLQAGTTRDLFGQEAAPASPSAPLGSEKALMTTATCGRNGSALSESAALHLFLESRLRERLAGLCWSNPIWSHADIHSDSNQSQPLMSGRLRSESDFGLWPTPT